MQLPGLTLQTGGQGNFKKMDSAGDPVIAFGPDGTAYYANIVFNRATPASGIAVSVSRTAAQPGASPTWSSYSDAGNFFHDKEWIARGQGRPRRRDLDALQPGPPRRALPRVADRRWPSPTTRARPGTARASRSPTSHTRTTRARRSPSRPNGDLYVAYEATDPRPDTRPTRWFSPARRTTAGHFEQATLARVYDDLDCYPVYNGRQTLTDMHFRLNSYPSMSIDPASGRIAITWADQQGSYNCGTPGGDRVRYRRDHRQHDEAGARHVGLLVRRHGGGWRRYDRYGVSVGRGRWRQGRRLLLHPAVRDDHGLSGLQREDSGRCRHGGHVRMRSRCIPHRSVCLDYAARTLTVGGIQSGVLRSRLTSDSSNPFIQFANGAFIGDYSQVAIGSDGVPTLPGPTSAEIPV